MADETKALATRGETANARSTFEVLIALQELASAELSKGPSVSSLAWLKVYNVIAEAIGDDQLPTAATVVGRQPMMIPPGFKNPIPAKGGAVPVRADQGIQPPPGGSGKIGTTTTAPTATAEDIRKRADVAAEISRVKGGKPQK